MRVLFNGLCMNHFLWRKAVDVPRKRREAQERLDKAKEKGSNIQVRRYESALKRADQEVIQLDGRLRFQSERYIRKCDSKPVRGNP